MRLCQTPRHVNFEPPPSPTPPPPPLTDPSPKSKVPIDHFTVVVLVFWPLVEARLKLTLL